MKMLIVNFLKINFLFYKIDDLSFWEQDFIKNLHSLKMRIPLTSKQVEKVDEIYLHHRGIKIRAKNSHHYLTALDYTYDEVHNFDR